ncbi:hypothetical protein [Lysobacter spongiicola]|uniref:Beta-barrel assembly machine subunit BamC n=1 Tax=Lysobacter spongiicola DSM 21749 TaxID=1122188 RepID=A0A1T4MS21_9GAMM|nr:hypothetical protein SAMN02745674_00556 [Lysobacter spongiicola DSM 21749]
MPSIPQMSRRTMSRTALGSALLVALVATSGCSWFRKTDDLYAQAPQNRPLEVPPDLDVPAGHGAAAPAGSVTASQAIAAAPGAAPAPATNGATASAATGFMVEGNRDAVFARVDAALAGIDGVEVASRAELLGALDINYMGSNFLVRVSDAQGGSYVSAVDPRGTPANSEASTRLIALLQESLAAAAN